MLEQTIVNFEKMSLIREFETTVLRLFDEGKLRGTTHTYIGQEANAVGVLAHVGPDDVVVSNHRCHGHYLTHTGDVDGLMAELMGRATGVCGGIGGSQHLCADNFYSNGVLGGTLPLAAGIAMAEKLNDTGRIVVVFTGDGAFGEGIVYETLNLSSLWELPILIVVENNQYAQSTPVELNTAGTFEGRFDAFGIGNTSLKSTNVAEIFELAGPIVDSVRRDSLPHGLIIDTYRLAPHSKGDDYRPADEIDSHREFDPIKIASAGLDPAQVESVIEKSKSLVLAAVDAAESAPFPGTAARS